MEEPPGDGSTGRGPENHADGAGCGTDRAADFLAQRFGPPLNGNLGAAHNSASRDHTPNARAAIAATRDKIQLGNV